MKILAVDDDEFILDILDAAVSSIGGHELELATSGMEAIDVINASPTMFDCFLLDIQMPEMTGIELCHHIRSMPHYADTPILIVTAMSDKKYLDSAFAAGATDYVTKPFDVLELESRIRFAAKMTTKQTRQYSTAKTLDLIVEQLTAENVYDLADVLPVLDVDRALNLHAFENYLQQLNRTQYGTSAIFAIKVLNIETIHARSTGREFGDQITDIAESISQCVRSIPGFFTYMGHGIFCCVIEGRKRELISELQLEIESTTCAMQLVYRNQQSVDVNYAVGACVTPSIFVRGKVSDILEKAIDNVDAGAPKKKRPLSLLRWA